MGWEFRAPTGSRKSSSEQVLEPRAVLGECEGQEDFGSPQRREACWSPRLCITPQCLLTGQRRQGREERTIDLVVARWTEIAVRSVTTPLLPLDPPGEPMPQ